VQWLRGGPWDEVTLPHPMTERAARLHLKRETATGRHVGPMWRGLRLEPLDASQGEHCARCGMLLRLHRRGVPQFESCYA
jgi:hypothetical protein